MDLMCVIDVSGSMKGDKINQVKASLKLLTNFLNESDRISIVIFNSNAERILKFTSGTPKK